MPKLKNITIRGFRSIKEMTLELRALNVLIGANGAGKSNLIAFFKLVSDVTQPLGFGLSFLSWIKNC